MKNKITKNNLIYLLLMLPFLEPPILGPTKINYIFLVLKAISVCVIGLYLLKNKFRMTKIMIPLILYELVIIISTIVNNGDIIESLSNAAAVLGICFIIDINIKEDMNFTLKSISIVYFIYSIINLLIIFLNRIPPFQGVNASVGFLGMDNRFIFTFLPMIVFATISSYNKNGKIDAFAIATIVISVGTLIYTWSVGAIIGILILAIYYLVFMKFDTGKIFNFRNCFIFIIVINILVVVFNFQYIFSDFIINVLHKDPSLTGRVNLWRVGIREIIESPILGYGVDIEVVKTKISNLHHFHNYFVNMIYTGGFLNFLMFIIFSCLAGKKMMQHKGNDYIKIVNCAIFVCLILSIADTLDYPFFFVYYIIAYNIANKISEKEEKQNREMTLKKTLKHKIGTVLFYLFRIFKIKNNKIICVNFHGRGYGDSEKYIAEKLLAKENNIDIVWSVNENVDVTTFPKQIRFVKIYSIKWIYEMATSKIWINNSRFEYYVRKRKNQYYIQTWHGGLALKKIEFDAVEKLSKYYEKSMINDSKMIDLMVSNSKFCTDMYKRGFKYNGEIIETGTPRNDVLIKSDYKEFNEKVKSFYNINKENNILIYAPTFRNQYISNPYDIDFKKIINILENKTNKKWSVLIKLHPNIKDSKQFINTSENIIDASKYPDMQELIMGTDILITDYSSTMFEAMIANKPVYLYAKDLDAYNEERGTYFKFEELPFCLAQNQNELKDLIEKTKDEDIIKKYNEFKNEIGLQETGNSSDIVADIIINKINI